VDKTAVVDRDLGTSFVEEDTDTVAVFGEGFQRWSSTAAVDSLTDVYLVEAGKSAENYRASFRKRYYPPTLSIWKSFELSAAPSCRTDVQIVCGVPGYPRRPALLVHNAPLW